MYTMQEMKNKVLNYVNSSNVKCCLVDIMTGEIITANNVQYLKQPIYEKTLSNDLNNIRIFGIDQNSVNFLNEYLLKCKKYLYSKKVCSENEKIVICECCNGFIKVNKNDIDDGWMCLDCIRLFNDEY